MGSCCAALRGPKAATVSAEDESEARQSLLLRLGPGGEPRRRGSPPSSPSAMKGTRRLNKAKHKDSDCDEQSIEIMLGNSESANSDQTSNEKVKKEVELSSMIPSFIASVASRSSSSEMDPSDTGEPVDLGQAPRGSSGNAGFMDALLAGKEGSVHGDDEEDAFVDCVSSSFSDSSSSSDRERHVHFGDAEIREYARTMDYHPCVSSGVPLGLDWNINDAYSMPLEAFEAIRASDRCPGGRQEYSGRGRLDPKMRFAIALGSGHTVNEVEHMAQQVDLSRGLRSSRSSSSLSSLSSASSSSDDSYLSPLLVAMTAFTNPSTWRIFGGDQGKK